MEEDIASHLPDRGHACSVVLAQLAPVSGVVEPNVAAVVELAAAHHGADLIVLPELFLGGYRLDLADELAIDRDGPEIARMRQASAEHDCGIVVGFAERVADGVANSAAVIERGTVAGIYRKTHLFGNERDAYVPGDELEPIEAAGRRLGVMICFDLEFPEVARTLHHRGADLFVTPACNPVEFAPDHDLAARARALENGTPNVYVNLVGEYGGLSFPGESQLVGPDGRAELRLGNGPAVVRTDVEAAGHPDGRLQYDEQFRPELYELETRNQEMPR
ncbi:MAG: 5-aminopentanamidase [Thermoleophilaceae bacterium]|nr:5-aminopentanamidase [Thermoleophilaceae bacterium]